MITEFLAWLSFHQVTNPDAYAIRALAVRWAPSDTTLFEVCEALIGPDWLSL